MWRIICGGCGAGQRDDARGLILVPPSGRDLARVGGARQVMPPWLGSWVVPVPALWCAYWRGAGYVHDVFDVGAVDVVIRWAAVQFVLRVCRPVLQMRSILVLSEVSCNSCFIEKHIPLHRL